ncbi:hypothetical protein IJ384_00775 [bacterium]|nr:hypothetical protein [bacterium]
MTLCVSYPNQTRNYCVFDEKRVSQRKNLELLKKSLENPKSEDEIIEDLYVLNCMLDEGEEKIAELYPTLSKYNSSKNPNIQTFLAGIYRKTKVPDAFGPLCVMLIQNAIEPHKDCHFDPNEEIGGAILDYLA